VWFSQYSPIVAFGAGWVEKKSNSHRKERPRGFRAFRKME
jgi:hypothetical protein